MTVRWIDPRVFVIALRADGRGLFDRLREGKLHAWPAADPAFAADLELRDYPPCDRDSVIFRLGEQSTTQRVVGVFRCCGVEFVGLERVWTHVDHDHEELKLKQIEDALASLRECSHDPLDQQAKNLALARFDAAVRSYRGVDLLEPAECVDCNKKCHPSAFRCDACQKRVEREEAAERRRFNHGG